MKIRTSELKKLEEKAFAAGGGVWLRNSDYAQVYVRVTFYPRTRLWIGDIEITKEELLRDYHRTPL